MNIAFFFSIDLSYLKTFFTRKTAPQYTCELFLTSEEESAKFRAAFKSRSSFTKEIRDDVKEWVSLNIDGWKEDHESWFKIEMIPDDMLPAAILEAEGGPKRRRCSIIRRRIKIFESSAPELVTTLMDE